MLGKLLKYDLKWLYKVLIVFYILALSFALIGRGLSEIENSIIFNILGQISIGISIAMMISIIMNNFLRMWARIIRNIYKDESYLTHTLPVNKKTIYLSKALTGIITMFTSTLVILLCIAICYYSKENIEFIKTAMQSMVAMFDSTVFSFLLIIAIAIFSQLLFILFSGNVGIIIAHRSNNSKIVKSLIFGYIAYIIPEIIMLGGLFVMALFNSDIMNLFKTNVMPNIEIFRNIMYLIIAIYILFVIIYYFIGKKQFEKGVNVE